MARPQRLGLSAVRSEGAILPPSILQRIHREDPSLGGMTPDDFGLSGLRVREAASQAWNSLQAPWRAFQAERERLSATAPTAGVTRTRWLNQIAKALDYGAIDPLSDSVKLEGREFPVSHLYRHTPIHWVGFRIDLDHRTPGEKGAARMSPHGLVQLLLNASGDYLWGFVSNGLKWRILRDDNSLSRQSMVEFDLEAIFEGQLYDEFLLFYLLCHQTRVRAEKPEECWLERWSQAAANEGKRALDTLRNGVEKAIETLGQGFLRHPANQALRQSLRDGTLEKQVYYRQLLRMVYRLLFLFVAEDRNLLLVPEASLETRDLYTEYYSTQRLRLLAERLRGSHRHHDLFQQLRLILGKLGLEDGCRELGLPALGGFLFSAETCPDLDGAELSNADFLQALRLLAVTQEGGRRTRVDYKNLASEEMGSVYESLLELHPDLSTDGTKFELRSASGNERKTTGSYYTPDSLIQCLLDTALDPVVDEAVRTARQEFTTKDEEPPEAQAILALRVIDPAVGSGHFLIAAAHRMAKRLAQARTGDDEPAPDATRRALRDVIGRCLYGIDVNPMSAELCKVALWMEALVPGKPLSFLDHHIVVGNSLLGATPELITAGIPDDAYIPIEGDDKAVCIALKRQNKAERVGQGDLFSPAIYSGRGLLSAWERLEGLADDTLASIQKKAQQYREAKAAVGMRKCLADAWCAAFIVPKVAAPAPSFRGITTSTLRTLAAGKELDALTTRAVDDAASHFGFLHPNLTFPDVFASGGFDVVLGNPPWERVKIQEKEWFAQRSPEVANARNAAARKRLIASLKTESPTLYKEFVNSLRLANSESHFLRSSKVYPLCGRGDINTFALFVERGYSILSPTGRLGLVVPPGIATDATYAPFIQDAMKRQSIVSFYDFTNRGYLFPSTESTFAFALITLSQQRQERTCMAAQLWSPTELRDGSKAFEITAESLRLLNPNTLNFPIIRNREDFQLMKAIYERNPILCNDIEPSRNTWDCWFGTAFHSSNDSSSFVTEHKIDATHDDLKGNWIEKNGAKFAPLYESKLTSQFNHRYASFIFGDQAQSKYGTRARTEPVTEQDLQCPSALPIPRYWVASSEAHEHLPSDWRRGWLLGYRRTINAVADSRSISACILPFAGVADSIFLMLPRMDAIYACAMVALVNSFVFDYVGRQKASGGNLSFYVMKQLPLPERMAVERAYPWSDGISALSWIGSRVLELTYTASDLQSFATDCGWLGHPFPWDADRRFLIRCELDAAFFHLFMPADADGRWLPAAGTSKDEVAHLRDAFSCPRVAVEHILNSFPIVRRRDEERHGVYRTQRVIMDAYDSMQDALLSRQPYITVLDPPPANGWTPPLRPLKELLPKTADVNAAIVSAISTGSRLATAHPAGRATVSSEPEELLLTSPTPKPLRDKDGQVMRVRVYSATDEVLLNRGCAVGKRKSGDAILWSVLADGETVPRDFVSPPCVVKRLKPKGD